MSKDDLPILSKRGLIEADKRARRQAEALRANLARRKTQGNARAETEGSCPDEDHALQDPET